MRPIEHHRLKAKRTMFILVEKVPARDRDVCFKTQAYHYLAEL